MHFDMHASTSPCRNIHATTTRIMQSTKLWSGPKCYLTRLYPLPLTSAGRSMGTLGNSGTCLRAPAARKASMMFF